MSATHSSTLFPERAQPLETTVSARSLVPVGRVLFAAIFVISSFGHFGRHAIDQAAAQGVPLASFAVPLSGFMSLVGGLCIAFGYRARLGAWLIVLFLVPVTLTMHAFWKVDDPVMHQMQLANFMKNVAMLGAALFIAYFGSGPIGVDNAATDHG